MPPKRSAFALASTRVKLEDVDAPPASVSKRRLVSARKTSKQDSDSDASESAPRRSPRKRQRIPPPGGIGEDLGPGIYGNSNRELKSESSLTPLEESDYEEEAPRASSSMNLSKFAHAPSRPTRAAPKTPLKQVKLEEMLPASDNATSPSKASAKKVKSTSSPTKKATNPSPRKKKGIVMELDTPHPAPPNWERQYKLIEEMRANVQAPVDTMGCCKAMTGQGELKDQRFGVLVSLMLSSQTRDEMTAAAVTNLRTVLPGGLTVTSIIEADLSVISQAINKVGFWRRKAEYVKEAAGTLRDKFDGDVPKTVDELCSIKGIGPKMAFLILQVAWDINAGIGVDVHVQRITNRLGWHKPATTTPEQTRLNLQSWLPLELRKPINPLLVGFGQVICLPIGPRCDSCTLATEGLCPSARADVSAKGRKPIVYTSKVEPKAEVPDAPNLDVVGLIRVEDEVKKEEEEAKMECDVGEPRVQIKFEE
ncbi:DNA N-glycosylase and apurinic/apyrimidinic (AP) lyase [Ceratobasidium sp. 428]|nr:DNA N-glycosylase and apurinic/apyrimidinic (AP) lyase [Ceratobasidium sp. 428]